MLLISGLQYGMLLLMRPKTVISHNIPVIQADRQLEHAAPSEIRLVSYYIAALLRGYGVPYDAGRSIQWQTVNDTPVAALSVGVSAERFKHHDFGGYYVFLSASTGAAGAEYHAHLQWPDTYPRKVRHKLATWHGVVHDKTSGDHYGALKRVVVGEDTTCAELIVAHNCLASAVGNRDRIAIEPIAEVAAFELLGFPVYRSVTAD